MKKLFIVFEGMDGSGKTSLAKEFSKMFKVPYVHNDKCKTYEEGKQKSYEYINELDKMKGGVIDRLVHTGEAVYAPIYRNYDGSDYFEDLESKMMDKFNILIVYVYATDEVINERLDRRGEDYIDKKDIKELKDNYEKFLSKTKFPVLRFNNGVNGLESNAHILMIKASAKINREFNKK